MGRGWVKLMGQWRYNFKHAMLSKVISTVYLNREHPHIWISFKPTLPNNVHKQTDQQKQTTVIQQQKVTTNFRGGGAAR